MKKSIQELDDLLYKKHLSIQAKNQALVDIFELKKELIGLSDSRSKGGSRDSAASRSASSRGGLAKETRLVDIGCGVYIKSTLDFAATCTLFVGAGTWLELSLSEGISFLEKRFYELERKVENEKIEFCEIQQKMESIRNMIKN